jgi:hypothetical protein
VQFVTNGPDIPDALLQAHEEGRVVFFCGAGISYPAEALRLLDAIIADQLWAPQELGECLSVIVQAAPELAEDLRYQRLQEYARRRGV